MGTFGASSSKSKSSGTQTNTLNPWSQRQFEDQSSGIMGAVDKYNSTSPYKAYTGPMVAGLTGNENQARQIASTNVGSTNSLWGDAENAIKTGMSYDAADPSRYMNPFENALVGTAMNDIELQRQDRKSVV